VIILSGIFITCENLIESDTTPPVVSIQAPLSGETVNEIVTIQVSTSDNEGIAKVEFYIDDSLHFSDSNEPYEFDWNTAHVLEGSQHSVKVISFDTSDNSTESQPVLVIVDNSSSRPFPVNISSINYTLDELTIIWEKSNSMDFSQYQILHARSANAVRDVIGTANGIIDTFYTFTEFDPTYENWYWISVTDSVGLSSVGSGYMLLETPPAISIIRSIGYHQNMFRVVWTENEENDFHNYSLFESLAADMSAMVEIFSTTNRSATEYSVPAISNNEYRYYQIIVKDNWALESISPTMVGSSYPKITFSSDRDGNQDIFLIDINGNGVINLSNNPGEDSRPVFSADGTKIAFRSERDGNREIYSMDLDGRNQINLTNNGDRDANPEFSPDGLHIVFTSYRDGEKQIYLMDSDGSGQTNISNSSVYNDDPHFSPDGSKILFYRTGDLYMMDVNGNSQQRLSEDSYGGSFSPNGTHIIFSKNDGLFQIDYNGGNQIRLATGAGMSNPFFSPNGLKVIFTSGGSDIYIMNSDGTAQANLTNNSSYDSFPNFSPDGSLITFTSDRDGNGEIYIMNVDGTNQFNLTNHQEYDKFSVFQP